MEKMSYEDFANQCLSGTVKNMFIANLLKHKRMGEGAKKFARAQQFIGCAFPWSETPQGHNFWMGVASNLAKNPNHYAPKPTITIQQAVDKYLSGDVKKRFIAAMVAENDLPMDTMTMDDPENLVRSSFIWVDTADGLQYWIDIADELHKNPMAYAPKNKTYREFADKYLSGDIKEKFIKNCSKMNSNGFLDKPSAVAKEDSADFFYCAFVWSASPEGHAYWYQAADDFLADKKRFMPKHEAWVVASTFENRILDAFDTKELAEKAWGGCEGYTIKKYILAEVQ